MFGRRPEQPSRAQRIAQRSRRMARMVASVTPRTDVVYGGATSGQPVLKGPAAKPGKRTPTKHEAAWMTAIVAHGCICCWMLGHGYVYPEVHHILYSGRRMGHLFTLPLCHSHHQGGIEFASRHPWKERFIAAYGEEMALLATLQGVLKLQPDGSYAP